MNPSIRNFLKDLKEHADKAAKNHEVTLSEDLNQAIDLIQTLSESPWIPIEKAPVSDGKCLIAEVLVTDGEFVYEAMYHFRTQKFEANDVIGNQLTHWMPIPELPKKQ